MWRVVSKARSSIIQRFHPVPPPLKGILVLLQVAEKEACAPGGQFMNRKEARQYAP